MQIEISDDRRVQAIVAGFANVEEYIETLLDRDAERVAIHEGLIAMKEGRMKSLNNVDREFRQRNGLASQP